MKITRKQLRQIIGKTLNEATMVSLKPITNQPEPTQKSRWAKLSGISEEHIDPINESIMDMTPMEDLMATMAGEIVDRFGNEMTRLYDEEPDAFATEQPGGSMGRIDKSAWLRQVGRAELVLEDELQQTMSHAVQTIEARLHGGDYYDNVSSMGPSDSNSDGMLDPDELRGMADNLEMSEGWGIDTASRLPNHGVMIDDVKDEAVRLEKELYFINQSGRAFKALPDGSLAGLPNDELPSGIDDTLVYTRNS